MAEAAKRFATALLRPMAVQRGAQGPARGAQGPPAVGRRGHEGTPATHKASCGGTVLVHTHGHATPTQKQTGLNTVPLHPQPPPSNNLHNTVPPRLMLKDGRGVFGALASPARSTHPPTPETFSSGKT
eukprot:CAMPEP_0174321682 /NCGR_PEP_ID=MMETSP0810-20121108/10486_1 /TAXON_ID=73025 ORGANISM="Eutreptiella gymnastica-like, Strain CCMP1594" /NCGR_SAMPLE_ID=MMETSP0810 /ASSEMBLY_ACC=CAM_ASM_000659 /LENGTH=127 /DNA_ID=CAMNT_0015433223 /DNA_START=1023 /DNA_END=1403 /DNA_ORIENTATION=+